MSEHTSLYSPEIEQHMLGWLLNNSESWGEVSFAAEKDFSPVRQRIFSVIRQQLDASPPQPVSPVILTEKLKSYGQSTTGEVDTLVYLEGLQRRGRLIEKKEGVELLKQLKRLTVKRELVEKCEEAKRNVLKAESFDEMVGVVDKTLSSVNTQYFSTGDTTKIFEGMIDKIEEEGNNPLKDGEIVGPVGPFPSITETIGSLSYRGAWVTVGARTSSGKSSLSWFYNIMTAERSKVKMLTLDAAEMTPEEIQYRTICALSRGEVPYWALENRQWRRKPEWENLIRKDIWPRIRAMEKLDIDHYKNIGTMSPKEILAYVKRFYYNKVGRGNPLIINYDYIKGMSSTGRSSSSAEHQILGDFVNDFKSLITEEINACVWSGVQNNRTGIVTGRKGEEIAEENDGQMGLSDRIIQQSTHGFILRYKLPTELAREKGKFGNVKLVCVKKRKLTGRRYEELLYPIQLPDGKFVNNYFNLESKGFGYTDKGSLKDMLDTLGHTAIDLSDEREGEKMP